jgi:hypothetical protein
MVEESMRANSFTARWKLCIVPILLLSLGAMSTAAWGDVEEVIATSADQIESAQTSQARIDEVVDETEDLESEYKQVLKELDGLQVYNEYMERQIANQAAELVAVRESIDKVSDIERQIVPLMMRMLEGLRQFIELDVPFLKEERVKRVARLSEMMERPDVTVAEKFRRLTEAFQVENDFGRTIETYNETLVLDGATLEVNILRIGRVGLYYQTNDGSRTGMWDSAAGQWRPLSGGAERNQVRQGLRIARKQVAPELLLLPVSAPEDAS